MLNKELFASNLADRLKDIMLNRSNAAATLHDDADPNAIIEEVAHDMAAAIADSVDEYIASGEIIISSENIVVTAPNGTCAVAPADPAKMQ